MPKDLYAVLGVPKGADADAVRKAFRKLAAKHHPDRNPGKENEARFKELNHAHEVLSDPEKRSLYDEFGEEGLRSGFDKDRARVMRNYGAGRGGGGGAGGVNFQDIFGGGGAGGADIGEMFGDLFGQRTRRPRKSPDREAEVRIDFVSAIKGTTVSVSVGGPAQTVRIPPGVADGNKLRIAGLGGAVPGGLPGDLVLTVHVDPHPNFKREGDDLILDLPVTVEEAFSGAKVRVPTPDGEVSLKIAAGAQSGQLSRLRGKGATRKDKTRGDLYVRFLIRLPTGDSDELKEAIATLGRLTPDPREGIVF